MQHLVIKSKCYKVCSLETLEVISELWVTISLLCDIELLIISDSAILQILLLVDVAETEVQHGSKDDNAKCECTADGATFDIIWSTGALASECRWMGANSVDIPIRFGKDS